MPEPLWDEWISGYIDDALSPSERQRVEERLETDPQYRQTLEALLAQRRMFQKLPRRQMKPETTQRLLESIAADATGHRVAATYSSNGSGAAPLSARRNVGSAARSALNWRPATLFATSMAALVLVGFLWWRGQPNAGHLAQGDRSESTRFKEDSGAGAANLPPLGKSDLDSESVAPGKFAGAAEFKPDALGQSGQSQQSADSNNPAPMRFDAVTGVRGGLGGNDALMSKSSDPSIHSLGFNPIDPAAESNQMDDALRSRMAPKSLEGGLLLVAQLDEFGMPGAAAGTGVAAVAGEPVVDQLFLVVVPKQPAMLEQLKRTLQDKGLADGGFSLDGLADGDVESLYVRCDPAAMESALQSIAESTSLLVFDPTAQPRSEEPIDRNVLQSIPQEVERRVQMQILERRQNSAAAANQLAPPPHAGMPDSLSQNTAQQNRTDITPSIDEVLHLGRNYAARKNAQPAQALESADALELYDWLEVVGAQHQQYFFMGPGQQAAPNLAELRYRDLSERGSREQAAQLGQLQTDALPDLKLENRESFGRYLLLFGRDLPIDQRPRPEHALPTPGATEPPKGGGR